MWAIFFGEMYLQVTDTLFFLNSSTTNSTQASASVYPWCFENTWLCFWQRLMLLFTINATAHLNHALP